MRSGLLVLWGCLLYFYFYALPARAHDLSLSGIQVLLRRDSVVIDVSTPISRLIRAEGHGKTVITPVELDLAIRRRLHLRFDGISPATTTARVVSDEQSDQLSWQTTVPGTPKNCEVLARLYPEDPNARTAVTVLRDKQVVQEVLLDALHPALLRTEPPVSNLSVAYRYLIEGIGHIFGGPDHVAFVLGLLLLGGTLAALLRTVTAFTIAHSVTLTLAATGIYSPPSRVVEPLIALSIIAIAVENLRHFGHLFGDLKNRSQQNDTVPHTQLDTDINTSATSKAVLRRARDLRPYFAFGFGLIHGFGFAGALAEVGLPKSALGVALISFNTGVEVGQVAIILAVAPLLVWLATSRAQIWRAVVLLGSTGIGLAGAYWFFSRL